MSHGKNPSSSDHAHASPGHIVPVKLLAGVWLVLMVLTVLTVEAAKINFGELNLWMAMGIATVKASLVVLFFMHLYWDRPINGIIFCTSLLLVALFIGLALTDSSEYQGELVPGYAPAITSGAPPKP